MNNYEYIVTIHWAHFGPCGYPFNDFHSAFDTCKRMLKSPSVSYVTMCRKPIKRPSLIEAFQAWEILHREGRI